MCMGKWILSIALDHSAVMAIQSQCKSPFWVDCVDTMTLWHTLIPALSGGHVLRHIPKYWQNRIRMREDPSQCTPQRLDSIRSIRANCARCLTTKCYSFWLRFELFNWFTFESARNMLPSSAKILRNSILLFEERYFEKNTLFYPTTMRRYTIFLTSVSPIEIYFWSFTEAK